jgi:hypothetical protein
MTRALDEVALSGINFSTPGWERQATATPLGRAFPGNTRSADLEGVTFRLMRLARVN